MKARSLRLLTVTLLVTLGGLAAPSTPALAAPAFKVPFPCGQAWAGQTRTNHSPVNAVDFNRTDDLGDPVVASAPGTVAVVTNLGNTSYGRYVRINHGGGYSTLYAHLSATAVSVGQSVQYGQVIGSVGNTGNSLGAHLHYEQLLNGSGIKVRFNGTLALYWGTRTYTSDNGCTPTTPPPTTPGTATGTVNTASAPLTIRSGPGTSYAAVGTVTDGTRVTISCQTTGTSVTGTYGTSTIWDRIGDNRYISDAYVYTGSDGFIPGVPRC